MTVLLPVSSQDPLLQTSADLLGLFGLLLGDSLDLVFVPNRLHHALDDLTIFVDSTIIDSVDPSLSHQSPSELHAANGRGDTYLVDQNTKDDIVSEACQSMEPWHPDTEGYGSVPVHVNVLLFRDGKTYRCTGQHSVLQ